MLVEHIEKLSRRAGPRASHGDRSDGSQSRSLRGVQMLVSCSPRRSRSAPSDSGEGIGKCTRARQPKRHKTSSRKVLTNSAIPTKLPPGAEGTRGVATPQGWGPRLLFEHPNQTPRTPAIRAPSTHPSSAPRQAPGSDALSHMRNPPHRTALHSHCGRHICTPVEQRAAALPHRQLSPQLRIAEHSSAVPLPYRFSRRTPRTCRHAPRAGHTPCAHASARTPSYDTAHVPSRGTRASSTDRHATEPRTAHETKCGRARSTPARTAL